jgi:hypothetical protein
MAFSDDDGAAANGFPRRSLHQWEGHLLHQAGYPCLPDTRPPGGGWRLSRGGVPIPPPPRGHALDVAIEEARMTLTDEERAEPRHHPDNYTAWNSYFLRRWERELASYDGPPPPPPRNNAAGRRRWWSAPERTLANVLAHIEGGNFPVLTMPPASRASASRRRGNVWQPRRMAASSSSSGSAPRPSLAPVKKEATSPSTPARVKKEPASPPPTRGRSSGALVIRDQPSSPQRGRKRKAAKKEDAAAATNAAANRLAEEEAKRAEDAAVAEAIARSLKDLVPLTTPSPRTLPWSGRGATRSTRRRSSRRG